MHRSFVFFSSLAFVIFLFGCATTENLLSPKSEISSSTVSSSSATSTPPTPFEQTPSPVPSDNPESVGNNGENSSVCEKNLSAYAETFARFFHSPVSSGDDLPRDYNFVYYLLYQTFEDHNGSGYTQNEDYFWLIPEDDILETARQRLGITDLSISELSEWPFGAPQDGFCLYSEESSLPYSSATIESLVYDEVNSFYSVEITISDDQYEDASNCKATLTYRFDCRSVSSSSGNVIYSLLSIDES